MNTYQESIVVIAVVAANPDAKVMAVFAPSIAASCFSNTSRVGFPLLPYSYLSKQINFISTF
jgi:hypothetical protein